VDLRQVDLPFNGSERIAAVLVQEGDHVKKEQLLARLDTSRLAPQVAKAEADLAAQAASGESAASRQPAGRDCAVTAPNVQAAAADAANVSAQWSRLRSLSESSAGRAVSRRTWIRPRPPWIRLKPASR